MSDEAIVDPVPDADAADDAGAAAENDAEVERRLRRLSRRGFAGLAAGAVAAYAGWKWLRTRPADGGVPSPFRRMLQFNEAVALAIFRPRHLSPEFAASQVTAARVNGHLGLTPQVDAENWRLRIEGSTANGTPELTLADLQRLPYREMITELRCIEGWSIVVKWGGVRLSDVMNWFPPPGRDGARADLSDLSTLPRYVALETPGRGYYVGLDMPSAMHPQTLLAWNINGQPLSWEHGAPLRLAIPVKYGIKNIKRIGTIRYTDVRPADYWAEQGYDWYAGH